MIKNLHFFILLILLNSCVGDFKTNSLSEYKELKTTFVAAELTDLQLILEYYSSVICPTTSTDKNKIVHCFMDHLEVMKRNQKNIGDIQIPLTAEQQLELYNRLQPSTLSAIWELPQSRTDELPKNNALGLQTDGIYFKLLEILQVDYPPFKSITESTVAAGGISPFTFSELLNKHTEYNYFDDRVRLFFTLHYLTINDQNKKLGGGVK